MNLIHFGGCDLPTSSITMSKRSIEIERESNLTERCGR